MKKSKATLKLIKDARKFLNATTDPKLKVIARYLPQGMDLYLQMLKAVGAASKIKLASGISVKHVDFTTTSTSAAALGTMEAAVWIGNAVQIKLDKDRGITSKKICCIDPECPGDGGKSCSAPKPTAYFGADHEGEYEARINPTLRPQEDPALAPISENPATRRS
jgi:hypothetical protein